MPDALVELLEQRIRDADDLERLDRLGVEPAPPAKQLTVEDYPGGPAALITSPQPVNPPRC